ncbi:hypothetical protein KC367_g5008 [Hortaea werneckii]|nr:hypothetical protein KC357_g5905 [Hortaea werneckii]KAI7473691.1 hypothetical protein KC351_g10980 [Hortaea werneckii]KAI7498516.1 hypothetical protein KC367_g5008 [Hortaea werneckii]
MDSFDITGESHLETVIDLAEQVVVEVTGRFRQRRRYAYENGSFQVLKAFLLRLTDSIQEENTEDKQTAADLVEDCDLEDSRYRGVVKADTKICIIVATGGQITSPALSSAGIHAMMLILGNARQEEPFFPQYRIREPTFFTMGKVFSLLWDEKIDQDSKRITALERSTLPLSDWSSGSASMGFLSLKRYFIVLREGLRYCTALPIMTYDGEGVAAERCIKSDHAIAFTGPAPPNLRGNEHPRPGEHPIRPLPIRIVAIEDHELSPAARIDFATVYTIHHEVKVRPIGAADYGSIKALHQQFDSVWASKSLSSGERVLINNDRSYAKTIEATKKAQIKGKQAQRPSSSKHNNIPEHAAKAAFPQGEDIVQGSGQIIRVLFTDRSSDAKNKQTLNHEANPQNSSMFGPLYPATPLTDNQRHDDHEETENSIMTKAQACLDGFNQVVDHLEIFDKASAQDDRPRRLTEGVKPGLQSMDEWCDERARFKLAINDLRNVIDGDRFSTGDEHALRVTNGLLNDLRELERNLNQGARPRKTCF